jgi:hypothetical protein
MDEIGSRIRKLRSEIESALNEGGPLPGGVRLEAERVVLHLLIPPPGAHVSNRPTASTNGKVDLGGQSGREEHLTIEFRVLSPAASPASPGIEAVSTRPTLSTEALRSLVIETGTAVFGPQGFDNSARAEVFCELIAEQNPTEVLAALAIVEQGTQGNPDPQLSRSVARLRQILGFSPLGRESAAGRLRALFEQAEIGDVVSILGQAWRFGTHWPLSPSNGSSSHS